MIQKEVPQPLERFLRRAQSIVESEHRTYTEHHGSGYQHTITCPAHDDNNPSLSVTYDNGKVLLSCQADCSTEDILKTVGMSWTDLETTKHVVATYDYADVDGKLRYQVLRWEPKTFNQRRPDPKHAGRWINNMQGVEPLLFQESLVVEALESGDDVYITEGEKDALAMDAAYLAVATCNHGGAGKWKDTHSDRFVGTESVVTIVADRDRAGYDHALKVYESLRRIASIKPRLALPNAGKDVADHVSDHGLGSLIAVTEATMRGLLEEAQRTEESKKKAAFAETNSSGITRNSSSPGRLILRKASDITARVQKFLWKDRIPLGNLALFAGRGGVGKSSFAIWFAVEAQHGRLPGDLQGERVPVLYVSVEDDWETQMKPRLMAAEADMDTFYELSIGYTEDEDGERIPSLPQDTHLIREAIQVTGAKLVILDPITSTMSGDDHKRDVVRAVLDPLAKVAREEDAVIIGIMHFNKGGGSASDKASGSHAYRDAARALLQFARDEDEDHVVMTQDKGNYADFGDASLAYRLVDTPVQMPDGDISHVARVVMLGDVSTSVDQIINRTPGEDNGAVQWLSDFMREMGGQVAAETALQAAEQAGYTKNQITRARQKSRPKVGTYKVGMTDGWVWRTEESGSAEEITGISEEITFLNSEPFVLPSGDRQIKRPYRPDLVIRGE